MTHIIEPLLAAPVFVFAWSVQNRLLAGVLCVVGGWLVHGVSI